MLLSLAGVVSFALLQAPVARQSASPAPGTIAGSVIDATTGTALSAAIVTLSAADGLGLLGTATTDAPRFALARSMPTSDAGEYRFTDLPVGSYRLYVRRIGYMPTALDVRLGDLAASPLAIGLVVAPVRLRAVEVRAAERHARAGVRSDADRDDRIAAARARQRALLATDARELTVSDVGESATLAGGDVLRALQRLPGVTPVDDWSAKLLVRGNRWDHDRIYFDDLPLFDPLGALGRASGVSGDAIGGAVLHPGVRPVSLGGEGATRVDLRSRAATAADEWRGAATLSQLGLGGLVERARGDGRAGVAMTAQHSVAEWMSNRKRLNGALGDPMVADAQASLRADVGLGETSALEVSALVNEDARHSPSGSAAPASVSQRWGNVAGRVTYRAVFGGLVTSHTIGATHFSTRANDWGVSMPIGDRAEVSTFPTRSTVDYVRLDGRIASSRRALPTLGYELVDQRASLSGPRSSIYWGDFSFDRDARAGRLTYGDLWLDHRMALDERLTLEAGARADIADAIRPSGALQLRFSTSPVTLVSVGASRTHQYLQAVDLPSVARGPTMPSLWLTSGHDVPSMSVDNATLGAERWLGDALLLAGNVYLRRTSGAIVADPTPGPLTSRPLFVASAEAAHGIELSARKLSGRVTGVASYSYNETTTRAAGFAFPSAATRPHAFGLTTTLHAGATRVSGSFSAASGAPFTRVTTVEDSLPRIGESSATFSQSTPNAMRLPSIASLDVFVDRTLTLRAATLVVFAGAQNVLARRNRTWFQLSGICDGDAAPRGGVCATHNLIDAPLSFTPSIGLRLAF